MANRRKDSERKLQASSFKLCSEGVNKNVCLYFSAEMKARNQRSSVGLLIDKKDFRIIAVAFLLVMFMCSEKQGALATQGEWIGRSSISVQQLTVTTTHAL